METYNEYLSQGRYWMFAVLILQPCINESIAVIASVTINALY